jgi:hypothetical protein
MAASYDPMSPPWWVVRSIVDITVAGELSECEDRFVLVKANSEEEARTKGEQEAEQYGDTFLNEDGQTVTWRVRRISDVRGILNAEVTDGTEVYSSFVDPDLADILVTPRQSPLKAWEEANPGKDANEATVREILGIWEENHGRDTPS